MVAWLVGLPQGLKDSKLRNMLCLLIILLSPSMIEVSQPQSPEPEWKKHMPKFAVYGELLHENWRGVASVDRGNDYDRYSYLYKLHPDELNEHVRVVMMDRSCAFLSVLTEHWINA